MVIINLDPKIRELELVKKFMDISQEKKRIAALLSEKTKELDDVEAELMELLDEENKKSSARFIGIGHVTCKQPVPYASVKEEEEEILFEHLRKIGREDMIKTSVNSQRLSTLVRECLEKQEELPPGTNYYLKRKLAAYPEK